MSESNGIRRRDLLTAGVAGIVGAGAGYIYGRSGDIDDRRNTVKGVLPLYYWTLTVQGGYGWWFQTVNGIKTVTLLALDSAKCTCGNQHECIPHDMTLIVDSSSVEVDGTTSYTPTETNGIYSWALKGETRFISGMTGNGIAEPPRKIKWDDLKDPYAPKDPLEYKLWNDQVWLPERQTARQDVTNYTSAWFVFADGVMAVRPSVNEQAVLGRWDFDIKGVKKTKALTDVLALNGSSQDLIGIQTDGQKRIYLKPKGDQMFLDIRHQIEPRETNLTEGAPLKHFARLYDLVKDSKCDDFTPPTYHHWYNIGGEPTPGDLCPPLPLD